MTITAKKPKEVSMLVRLSKEQHYFLKRYSIKHRISIKLIIQQYVDYLRAQGIRTLKDLLHEHSATVKIADTSRELHSEGEPIESC